MRGRRPGKTGGVCAEIERGFCQAENDADGRASFAAGERSISNRLRGTTVATSFPSMREGEDSHHR